MAYTYGPYPQNFYQTGPQMQTAYPNEAMNPYARYQTAVPLQQPQPSNQQGNTSGFVWVQGEAGAKAYPVAAGNSVLLMDSENPVLYLKSTDAYGKPLPMEIYDLVKREPIDSSPAYRAAEPKPVDMSQYVKFCDLEEKVKELVNKALEG